MADKPNSKPAKVNSDAVPLHKKLAMGQKPDTGAGSGKKTPA
jgi:hypothetical protein